MFWNNIQGWQRDLWDDLAGLNTRYQTMPRYRRSYPGIKLYSNEDEAMVRAEVPGVSAEDLQLEVQDDVLNIALKREPREGDALRRERPYGEYEKAVRLPFRANPDNVQAELKAGVLTVKVARAEEDKPRKIAVAAS